ncbi:toxin Cry1Ac domain D-VI-related protein, partial [Enterococcus hirae]
MCLLTYPAFSSLPTFALESEGSPTNSPKVTVESPKQVDQSVYGNLLANPTLSYDAQAHTFSGWEVTTQSYVWNSPILNVTFNTLSENGNIVNISGAPGAYFKYNDNQLMINTTNQIPVCLISNSIRALAGRTYEATVTTLPGGTYCDYVGIRENSGVSSTSATGWHSSPGKISQTKKVSSNVELQMEFETSNGFHSIYDRNSIFFGLKYAAQWKAVDSLFTSVDHSILAPSVSTPQINQVKTLVTTTSYHDDRADMLKAIDRATQLLTKRDQELQQTILTQLEQLLINGELAPNVTLESLQPIQALIDQLSDATIKQPLQQKLQAIKEKILQKNISAQLEQLLV